MGMFEAMEQAIVASIDEAVKVAIKPIDDRINAIEDFSPEAIENMVIDTVDEQIMNLDFEDKVNDAVETYFTYNVDIDSSVTDAIDNNSVISGLVESVETLTDALDNLSDGEKGDETVKSEIATLFDKVASLETAVNDIAEAIRSFGGAI